MKISIELTLMPLQEDYEGPIKKFIKILRNSEFKVLENPLSTQIFGEYDKLMPYITEHIKLSFVDIEACVLNMKIVKSDRSDYEPDF